MTKEEQHMDALRVGNQIRIRGAKLRKQLKAGDLTIREAFERKHAQPLKVEYVLESLPGWGKKRVWKLLVRRLDLDVGGKRLSELSKHEKGLILRGVEDPDFWYV